MTVLLAFGVALVVCAASLPILLRTLLRTRAIDLPNERSSHHLPTPRGAGMSIVTAIVVSTSVVTLVGGPMNLWLMLPVAAMGVTGAVDDFRPLSSGTRLVIQGVTALGTTCLLYGRWSLGAAVLVAIGAFFLVAFTNAFNFMDGINGISGSVALVAGAWFVWLGQLEGRPLLTHVGAATVGACLAFLPFNAPRAHVFLGDSGSYALGFALAALAILAALHVDPWPTAFAPLVIYCADTGATLVTRLRNGDSLLAAHRDHLYQRLARKWESHLLATAFVLSCVVVSCGLALAGYMRGSVAIQAATALCVGAGYLVLGETLLKRGTRVA